MENKQGYDPSEFEDDDYTTPQPDAGKSIRGYNTRTAFLQSNGHHMY